MSSTITINKDNFIEGDETVILTPIDDGGVSYTLGAQTTATITIADFVELIFKDSFEDAVP